MLSAELEYSETDSDVEKDMTEASHSGSCFPEEADESDLTSTSDSWSESVWRAMQVLIMREMLSK